MDQREFQDWLKYHRSCFTGLNTWLDKLPGPGSEREGEPNRRDVLKRWFLAMRGVDFDAATAASEAMFLGKLDEPKGWDRHPAAIRSFALYHADEYSQNCRPRYVDGEETFRCPRCLDGGWVAVWHPLSMKAAREGRLGELRTVSSCCVACTCAAGRGLRKDNTMLFNDRTMLPVRCGHDPQEQKSLVNFVGGADK